MNKYDRFKLRCKGWRHGASVKPMDPARQSNEDYALGYTEGQTDRRRYMKQCADIFGVTDKEIKMSILRDYPNLKEI